MYTYVHIIFIDQLSACMCEYIYVSMYAIMCVYMNACVRARAYV